MNKSSARIDMSAVIRFIAASFAGMLVAFVLVVALEWFSSIVHPVPADFGGTPEEVIQHVARYPQWILAVVVPVWGITAFIGTWTAIRIGSRGAAVLIGCLLVISVVFNVLELPYPMWFEILSVLAVLTAAILGIRSPLRRHVVGSGEDD